MSLLSLSRYEWEVADVPIGCHDLLAQGTIIRSNFLGCDIEEQRRCQ